MIRDELKKYVFEPQFKKIVQYVQEQVTESAKRLGIGNEIKVNHGYSSFLISDSLSCRWVRYK